MSFDLLAFARAHRYRLRNLHSGEPVPPAKSKEPVGRLDGLDAWPAIVGSLGYAAMDSDQLSVFVEYRSKQAKTYGMRRLVAAGVIIDQEGDTEVGGTAPVECIEAILSLIQVPKLSPGNPSPNMAGLSRCQTPPVAQESTIHGGARSAVGQHGIAAAPVSPRRL